MFVENGETHQLSPGECLNGIHTVDLRGEMCIVVVLIQVTALVSDQPNIV